MSRFFTGKRVRALSPAALIFLSAAAAAQQPNTPQAAPPGQPAPPPAAKDGTLPPVYPPLTLAPKTPAQNPAQERYGAPRNPIVVGPEDLDFTKTLSLDRAVRIGLQRQNSIGISQQNVEAANARLTQARSFYYPQLTPTLNYNASVTPTQSSTFNGQTFSSSPNSESLGNKASASFTILDTGQRDANVGNTRRSAFAAAFGLGDERQSVILNVTQDYYNLVRYKELVRVQEQNVAQADLSLKIIEKQIEVGTAAKSDRLQSVSNLANARVSLLSAQSDYAVGEANLKNAMGVVTSQPLTLSDTRLPAPDATPDKLTVDDYARAAYANRLDIKQQQERVNAQGYNVRLAFINAGLTVAATINEGYDLNPVAGENRVFSVSISYPLFDGGYTRAGIKDAKAILEQERRTLDQLQQTARLQVDQALQIREVARQRVAAAQDAVAAGELNYQAATAKQQNGLINVLEVINAQVQLTTAQVQSVQAIYDYYIADAMLQRDIGLNDPQYSPRIPGARPTRFLPRAQTLNVPNAAPNPAPAPPKAPAPLIAPDGTVKPVPTK